MLQFIFVLFQRFQLPILVMVGVAGFILYCVSEYLARKNKQQPGSVKHCKELTFSLNMAALILMVADMITFYLLGYYDDLLHFFFRNRTDLRLNQLLSNLFRPRRRIILQILLERHQRIRMTTVLNLPALAQAHKAVTRPSFPVARRTEAWDIA